MQANRLTVVMLVIVIWLCWACVANAAIYSEDFEGASAGTWLTDSPFYWSRPWSSNVATGSDLHTGWTGKAIDASTYVNENCLTKSTSMPGSGTVVMSWDAWTDGTGDLNVGSFIGMNYGSYNPRMTWWLTSSGWGFSPNGTGGPVETFTGGHDTTATMHLYWDIDAGTTWGKIWWGDSAYTTQIYSATSSVDSILMYLDTRFSRKAIDLDNIVVDTVTSQGVNGLVADYDFDEGSGTTVYDKSGCGNNGTISGTASWVENSTCSALIFNGTNTLVSIPASTSLNIESAGTIEVWYKPTSSIQGGLVSWTTGSGWAGARIDLGLNTYYTGNRAFGNLSDGEVYSPFGRDAYPDVDFGVLTLNQWAHIAFAFDGSWISVYRDGLLRGVMPQGVTPETTSVPLKIGRSEGPWSVYEYLSGQVDKVRVYNRALSKSEILACYKETAATKGLSTSNFISPVISTPRAYPIPEKIAMDVDVRGMELPTGSGLMVQLWQSGGGSPVHYTDLSTIPDSEMPEVIFTVPSMTAGTYYIRAYAHNSVGTMIGQASTSQNFAWTAKPAAFNGVTILNNFVWELLNVDNGSNIQYSFNNPRDGWVYILTDAVSSTGGQITATLDSSITVNTIDGTPDHYGYQEAMVYLPSGSHTIDIDGPGTVTLTELTVRRIPALYYTFYDMSNQISYYQNRDRDFLWDDVLRNVNVIGDGEWDSNDLSFLQEWKGMGRKWVMDMATPTPAQTGQDGIDEVYDTFTQNQGMTDSLMDGIMVDEFGVADIWKYYYWHEALDDINANSAFDDRMIIPYCIRIFGSTDMDGFAQGIMARDPGYGYFAVERYLSEEPTEDSLPDCFRANIRDNILAWEDYFPGSTQRILMTLGFASEPNKYNLNLNPSVDFQVFMDKEFQYLATNPACFDLAGISEWHQGRADDETVLWSGKLYRHYAIEGNTSLLSSHPYTLNYIDNPDFEDGLNGWTVQQAQSGSIQAKSLAGFGRIQGRGNYFAGPGDHFITMTRKSNQPNRISQTITGLTPGQHYSVKLITANYDDVIEGTTYGYIPVVKFTLTGGTWVGSSRSDFQYPYQGWSDPIVYLTYNTAEFIPEGTSVTLMFSDWESDSVQGGPTDEEIIYSFVEVQPVKINTSVYTEDFDGPDVTSGQLLTASPLSWTANYGYVGLGYGLHTGWSGNAIDASTGNVGGEAGLRSPTISFPTSGIIVLSFDAYAEGSAAGSFFGYNVGNFDPVGMWCATSTGWAFHVNGYTTASETLVGGHNTPVTLKIYKDLDAGESWGSIAYSGNTYTTSTYSGSYSYPANLFLYLDLRNQQYPGIDIDNVSVDIVNVH